MMAIGFMSFSGIRHLIDNSTKTNYLLKYSVFIERGWVDDMGECHCIPADHFGACGVILVAKAKLMPSVT
jgi:hypothetical protein